jgi:hypothetical protein
MKFHFTLGWILLVLVFPTMGCGPAVPVKDEATLKKEAMEIDKKVKDGESGL